jgi:gas vesicle protein
VNETETRHGVSGMGLFFAFLGGAVVGTVATLLLAPRGAEAMKRLSEAADRSRKSVERMAFATREAKDAAKAAFTSALGGQPKA